jgi:hypothetical protein
MMDALKRFVRFLDPRVLRRVILGNIVHSRIIKGSLSVFRIGSANDRHYPELTYQAANRFPSLLHELLTRLDISESVEVVDVKAVAAETDTSTSAIQLGELFASHGSDKAKHGYHPVYASILQTLGRNRPLTVLEIGLGTSNFLTISTMGSQGVPGASLRGFRDFLPASTICGADVDLDILFHEDRIRTSFVDQTDSSTFDEMVKTLGATKFDLIVDDGLHSVESNMNTLLFALSALEDDGWLVIEDIPERTLIVWKSIVQLLNRSHFKARLVKANFAHLVLTQRLAIKQSISVAGE